MLGIDPNDHLTNACRVVWQLSGKGNGHGSSGARACPFPPDYSEMVQGKDGSPHGHSVAGLAGNPHHNARAPEHPSEKGGQIYF